MNSRRAQIISILAFPIVLTLGIVLIPVVTDYADHSLAEQAVSQTFRWFSGHLLAAIDFAISIVAVGSVDRHLQLSSRTLPSLTLPFIAVGTILFGLGLLNTVVGSIQVGLLTGRSRYISFVAVLVFIVAPMILSGWALYAVAVASFGVFVPLALAIKRT